MRDKKELAVLLDEQRQQLEDIYNQADKLSKTAKEENRKFNDEEAAAFEKCQSDLESIEAEIGRTEWLLKGFDKKPRRHVSEQEGERDLLRRRKSYDGDEEDSRLTRDQFNNAVVGWMFKNDATPEQKELAERAGFSLAANQINLRFHRGYDPSGAPLKFPKSMKEWELQCRYRAETPLEARDQSTSTPADGGYVVPDDMIAAIDKAMLHFGGMRQVSRVVSTATGRQLPMPTVDDTSSVGQILAENVADGTTDVTLGQKLLDAYKITSDMVKVSFELLQDSSENWGSLLADLLAERIARAENTLATTGTGSGQHQGVIATGGAADSSVTLASATAITYAELQQIKFAVDRAYRMNGTWMFNDTWLQYIMAITGSDGHPMWQPDIRNGEPGMLLGHNWMNNQDFPSATSTKVIAFGDFQKFWIREVQGFVLRRSDERFFENFQAAYVGYIRSDSEILQANAIKYATSG